jgi:hypothetical protein
MLEVARVAIRVKVYGTKRARESGRQLQVARIEITVGCCGCGCRVTDLRRNSLYYDGENDCKHGAQVQWLLK